MLSKPLFFSQNENLCLKRTFKQPKVLTRIEDRDLRSFHPIEGDRGSKLLAKASSTTGIITKPASARARAIGATHNCAIGKT